MSYPIPSTFTRYSFSEEEQVLANSLTTLNIQGIQNLICSAAEEKLSLKFDPSAPHAFIQREAELQGQIGILQMLVQMAEDSVQAHHIITQQSLLSQQD